VTLFPLKKFLKGLDVGEYGPIKIYCDEYLGNTMEVVNICSQIFLNKNKIGNTYASCSQLPLM
jgi:hypothetical protein